jgi:antitoxin component of RelBE/YafQ-DinJ toxin-antitoxin module
MLGTMNDRTRKTPKAEVTRVLERVGLPHDTIREILEELPDPVDLDRDAAVFDRYGLTHSRVMDMLGGSP